VARRYREELERVDLRAEVPTRFRWRGREHEVVRILGHWREDPGWWRGADGGSIRISQADLWRVEASNGTRTDPGVFEIVRREDVWHLDRIWD
jgi:hypothetical protein